MNYFLNYSRMKNTKNKKGFTLIELLVVITIIGILATWAAATYTSQIQKARDTTRITDVKALQSAVEQVFQDTWEYPHLNTFFTWSSVNVSTYLPKLPRDPKNWQTCNNFWITTPTTNLEPCVYVYATWPDSNNIDYWTYIVSTAFESKWKVESDWTRDWWAHNWRWEAWNWVMMATKLSNDVSTTAGSNCLATRVRNFSWIKNEVCNQAATPSNWRGIITIHWS